MAWAAQSDQAVQMVAVVSRYSTLSSGENNPFHKPGPLILWGMRSTNFTSGSLRRIVRWTNPTFNLCFWDPCILASGTAPLTHHWFTAYAPSQSLHLSLCLLWASNWPFHYLLLGDEIHAKTSRLCVYVSVLLSPIYHKTEITTWETTKIRTRRISSGRVMMLVVALEVENENSCAEKVWLHERVNFCSL